jgi:hypothetical protein
LLKSVIISIGKYIVNTVAGKIIAGAAATAVIATGSAVTYNAVKPQPITTTTAVSTTAKASVEYMSENNSSEITNSETMNSTDPTDNAVSRINEAADSAVSRVNSAADEAVSRVQASASSQKEHIINVEKKTISWQEKGISGSNINCDITYVGAQLNEESKTISIDYAGHFYHTDPGIVIKNANGDILPTEKSFCKLTIHYNDITDISTLYFCCHDQKIKITVTE